MFNNSEPTARRSLLRFTLVALAALCSMAAVGCDTANPLNPTTTSPKVVAEEHVAEARMPESIAIGESPGKTVVFAMDVVEIVKLHDPKEAALLAAEGELLAVLDIKFTNNDDKDHRIPIAGYTFGGPGFNIPSATIDDQTGQSEFYKSGDGTVKPGETLSGHLVTRIPENRISKPFLFSLWFDEKREIFIEICRQKSQAHDPKKGQALPPCESDRELSETPVFIRFPEK